MKKMLFLSIMLAIITSNYVIGQQALTTLPPGNNPEIQPSKPKGVDGSPYLFDNWKPGIINLRDGNTIQGLSYRYNVQRNEMQFLYNNKEYAIGDPDSIMDINLDGKRFIFAQLYQNSIIVRSFYEVLTEGKVSLLIKYYIEVVPASYNVSFGTGNPNEQMYVKQRYCLKVDNKVVTLDKKGKELLNALSDKKEELAAYIKKEDISIKKKEGILKILSYYNSL